MPDSRLLFTELRADIDAQFNSVMIQSFLYGMYTLITAQAIWKLHKKANKLLYSSSLIFLWTTVIFGWIAFCGTSRAAFVLSNRSPITMFNKFQTTPFVEMAASTMGIFVSDAILIRRCYILWRKKYVLIFLLTLLMATTVLRIWSNLRLAHKITGPLIGSLGTLSSFITTVSTTSLIALKIILVTRRSHMQHSYSRVLEILIQSAAFVAIVTLGGGILELASFVHPFQLSTSSGRFWFQASAYFDCLLSPAIGISPTLIALRVEEESSATKVNTSQTGPHSYLAFRRSTHTHKSDDPDSLAHTSTIQIDSTPHMGRHGERALA